MGKVMKASTKSKKICTRSTKIGARSKKTCTKNTKACTKNEKACTKNAKTIKKSTEDSKKCKNPTPEEKKPLMIGPRLRLEPRLTPTPTFSSINIHNQDTKGSLLDLIEKVNTNIPESASLLTTSPMEISSNYEQENKNSKDSECNNSNEGYVKENTSLGKRLFHMSSCNKGEADELYDNGNTSVKKRLFDTSSACNRSSTVQGNIVEGSESKNEKRRIRKGYYWNDRELKDLAIVLQNKGFANLKEISDFVKTKTENDVRVFLKARTADACALMQDKTEGPRQRGRPRNLWNAVIPENLVKWPNIRKWRRAAYEQMMFYTRMKDFSKPSIVALCKQFHDEEEEPSDPEVINTKMIYKYMMDCMAGQIPPQLPPKESALLLDLLREVRLMPLAYDFEEERKFLNEFKSATIFKPFQLKDEFKRRFRQAPDPGPNAVLVPEKVYMELSRHKRVVQSFNPLVTPVWMIQREQEFFKHYLEDESVYID